MCGFRLFPRVIRLTFSTYVRGSRQSNPAWVPRRLLLLYCCNYSIVAVDVCIKHYNSRGVRVRTNKKCLVRSRHYTTVMYGHKNVRCESDRGSYRRNHLYWIMLLLFSFVVRLQAAEMYETECKDRGASAANTYK